MGIAANITLSEAVVKFRSTNPLTFVVSGPPQGGTRSFMRFRRSDHRYGPCSPSGLITGRPYSSAFRKGSLLRQPLKRLFCLPVQLLILRQAQGGMQILPGRSIILQRLVHRGAQVIGECLLRLLMDGRG